MRTTSLFLATGLLLAAGAAAAQERAVTPSPAPDTPFAGAALGEGDLGRVAGREDTGALVASATQRNTVVGNSVIGRSTTGAVAISGNAFQNLQGLAVINANSGNNVAINAAMSVTVNLAPR